ncbi:30S ribosomal protein S20 [candidate division WWE3 bacterium]|uniref:Small ribosomal subunit protein bS20 n=1 Tax=candidate division WWE3 bacterium TaxID=2053526 RepID=A0A928TWW9_UNCKA|nr:30S ribosomal protein S20 [candidate division WWE3 bacterium]
MPNKRAAMKDLRQSKKRQARNIKMQTHVKHSYKDIQTLLRMGKTGEATQALLAFQKTADKAARGKSVHRNKANRLKSRLMKRLAGA